MEGGGAWKRGGAYKGMVWGLKGVGLRKWAGL